MKKVLLALFLGLCFGLTGSQIESSISGYVGTDGNPIANGSLHFYVDDGSSTLTTVYSDKYLKTPVLQPIVLNNAGLPTSGGNPVTLFYNGTCHMVIIDSSNAIVYDKPGLSYTNQVNFGGLYVDILNTYGSNDTALTNALAAVNAALNYTFLFEPATYLCSIPHVFPSNVTLKFMLGAKLTISSAPIISGNIDAGAYRIFYGSVNPIINTANNPIILDSWYGQGDSTVVIVNTLNVGVLTGTINATAASITNYNQTKQFLAGQGISKNMAVGISGNSVYMLNSNMDFVGFAKTDVVSGNYLNVYTDVFNCGSVLTIASTIVTFSEGSVVFLATNNGYVVNLPVIDATDYATPGSLSGTLIPIGYYSNGNIYINRIKSINIPMYPNILGTDANSRVATTANTNTEWSPRFNFPCNVPVGKKILAIYSKQSNDTETTTPYGYNIATGVNIDGTDYEKLIAITQKDAQTFYRWISINKCSIGTSPTMPYVRWTTYSTGGSSASVYVYSLIIYYLDM